MKRGISIHIGLNAVDPKCYDGSWAGTLVGAVQDANDMFAIATAQGFQATKLLGNAATREAVTQAIFQASTTLVAGDILWVSFAGHGGVVRDVSGDESDMQDETWCLYDGHLLDDELYLLWRCFAAGVRSLVVSDSCHSGTVTRGSMGKPRAMPREVAFATWKKQRDFYLNLAKNTPASDDDTDGSSIAASVRLLAASGEGEFAYDGVYAGVANGYFTYALKNVWNNGRFKGDYISFFNQVYALMVRYQPPEHSLIGAADSNYDVQRPFQI